jgi:hypothetical protein
MYARKPLTEDERAQVQERLEASFYNLDIYAEVEAHTPTQLNPARSGKQATGACPYDDCSGDHDGFIVWAELTSRGNHYMCRTCRRSGHILKLVMDIKHTTFLQACALLGIPNPYQEGDTPVQVKKPVSRVQRQDENAKAEVEMLHTLYPRMQHALKCERARAYLAQRAIPFDVAVSLGLGYIPPLADIKRTPELEKFSKWCDRIIFPLLTPDGQHGFIGRALAYWVLGMDENEHKEILKVHHINRYEKTNPAGYFHWQITQEDIDTLSLVEGPFDALACVAAGIHNVAAMVGTAINAEDIPLHIESVILSADADLAGQVAAKRLGKALKRKGIDVAICKPDRGNDWSEAYRLHGGEGLVALREILCAKVIPAESIQEQEIADTCIICGATVEYYTNDGKPYCAQHWGNKMTRDAALANPVVQEVIKLFNAKVTIDPPGYTIDDRVRELQLEAKQARLVEDKRMLAATPWYGNSGGLTHAQWHAIPKGKVWMSIVQRDPDACRRYGL